MTRMHGIWLIALLCTLQIAHARYKLNKHFLWLLWFGHKSPAQKLYNTLGAKVISKTESSSKAERLREAFLRDAQLIIARSARRHGQCSSTLKHLKRTCVPSNRHAKKLIQFLRHPGALENEPYDTQAHGDEWAYNVAKAMSLIPLLLYKELLLLPASRDAPDAALLFSDVFKKFDEHAQKIYAQLNKHHEKVRSVAQLLHSAQVQSKRMQEVLSNIAVHAADDPLESVRTLFTLPDNAF